MTLETLIQDYGYWAVLAGTFLEGETVLLLGALAAHLGYMELPYVIAAAFAGAFGGDQLCFFLGRYQGRKILDRWNRWRTRTDWIFDTLHRHHLRLILGGRFLYGMRTVIQVAIGMSGLPPARFVVLNGLSVLAWATAIGLVGYLSGQAVESLAGDVKRNELFLMAAVLAGGGLLASLRLWRGRARAGFDKDGR